MFKKFIFALFLFFLCLRPFLSSLAFPREDVLFCIVFILACLLLADKSILRCHKNPAFLPLVLFLSAILVSTFSSKDVVTSLSQFYKYATYFFAFLVVSSFDRDRKKMTGLTLLLGSLLVSLYALSWLLRGTFVLMDYLKINRAQWDFASEYLSRGRAFVPFTTPSALGGYLVLLTPMSVAFLSAGPKKNSLKDIFALLAVFCVSLGLLSAQSIGAILSLAAALCVYSFIERKKIKRSRFLTTLLLLALCTALVVALRCLNILPFNDPLFSFGNRITYWKHALSLIREHPVVGIGLGNYSFFKSFSPHNSYLQIWAETGLLGLIAFLGLCSQILKRTPCGKTDIPAPAYDSFWIGSLAFLIHNFIDFTFFLPEICLIWWVVAALLMRRDDPNS